MDNNDKNKLEQSIDELKSDLDTLNQGGLNLKEDFIGQQVNNWLDKHPEATTTVQDNSLISNKMHESFWNDERIKQNYVTPQMFGAKADGITDDTEAIVKANEFLNGKGGTLLFPTGTYLIGTFNVDMNPKGVLGFSAIMCYSNITYKGEPNAVIKVADNINTDTTAFQSVFTEFDNGLHDVTFDNLIFELNGGNNLFPSSLRNKAYMCAGIRTLYPKNITIKNCKFLHCPGLNCVSLGHAENATIFNNQFLDCADTIDGNTAIWDHSAFISHGKNINVLNNMFSNSLLSSVASGLEINTENSVVTGNTFINQKVGLLISPISSISVKNISVSNNYFKNNATDVSLWSMDDENSGLDGVIINSNIFESNMGSNACIDIFTHIRYFCKNIIISNNKFKMIYDNEAIYIRHCVYLGNGVENIKIHSNIVETLSGYFIYVYGGCKKLFITDNAVRNCSHTAHSAMPDTRPYIIIDSNTSYVDTVVIKNNYFEDVNGSLNKSNCLMFLSDCRYVTIADNVMKGFGVEINNDNAIFNNTTNNYFMVTHKADTDRPSVSFKCSKNSKFIIPFGIEFVKRNNDLGGGYLHLSYDNSIAEVGSSFYCEQGSIIRNTTPNLGTPTGWVCIESGWGGTWKPFGIIE